MRFILVLLVMPFVMSCSNNPKRDMTDYELNDFLSELDCDSNRQCKGVLWGRGDCPYLKSGAAGYFTYSTKIGRKNIRHLKQLAAASMIKPTENKTGSGQSREIICLSYTYVGQPEFACLKSKCERVH